MPPGAVDKNGNPLSAEAATAMSEAAAQKAALHEPALGTVGFQSSRQNDPKFSLPSVGDLSSSPNLASSAGEAAHINAIPNGGGGGIPGAGGSPQAALGSGGGRGSAGAAGSSVMADIDQGFRAGGFAGYGADPASDSGADDNARGGRGPANRGAASPLQGLDLKRYLPGGAVYKLAGVGRREINAKEENIWVRISRKYSEKCKLGELYHCDSN